MLYVHIYMVRSEILNAKMVILHLSAFFFVVYPALDSIHIYICLPAQMEVS